MADRKTDVKKLSVKTASKGGAAKCATDPKCAPNPKCAPAPKCAPNPKCAPDPKCAADAKAKNAGKKPTKK